MNADRPLMPELPEPAIKFGAKQNSNGAQVWLVIGFTPDQLRAYGLAVWKAAIEAAAHKCEEMLPPGWPQTCNTEAQTLCAKAIRSLPLPESDMTQARGE